MLESSSGTTGQLFTLTVMGTTDLHGNVFNWNYFADREYDDADHNDIGLAKVSTLVEQVRHERGTANTVLVDAGDTLQGTPLAYYFAKVEPIGGDCVHPMAAAMNQMRYDAAALGNHEFNYGIPLLRRFAAQLDFPLLGANAVDARTGEPAFPPYVLRTVQLEGAPAPVCVGILGLTNPGIAIWDKAHVEGRLRFPGLVEHAQVWVPAMRRAGADVVVVAAHSGADTSSSYGDQLPYLENASSLVAASVPGIDAIVVGHSHVEIPERFVTNDATGRRVVLTEPAYWGMRLSLVELDLRWSVDAPGVEPRWQVAASRASVRNANTAAEDTEVVRLLKTDHDKVIVYVNSVLGTCRETMSAATARFEPTAALDLINHVQAEAVRSALDDSPHAHLPVLSSAAPFSREAAIPAGRVSIRNVVGLYLYDNTLLAVRLTGAELADYLEQAAAYFRQVPGPGPFAPDEVTNAPGEAAVYGAADHTYNVVAGIDGALAYDIDLARPAGDRIHGLTYAGRPVTTDQEFALAVNSFRQSGGGNYPHVTTAEVLYNRQVEIRQLLTEWVGEVGEIQPAGLASAAWRLVADGVPLVIRDAVRTE